ncbi:MAG: glutamine synthetase [Chloroflexi bacterium]|nr:glutamine synthetase [Chloroflexota bacterium]MCI0818677.1 glutamine synthetase [Chloroflexota bacterium]MCI0831928.1 glutamine synthetase [Chloroflexota bacterium]MCI0842457.1 glutamine synthetase [Chloroflexota bacterium]
MLTLKDLRAKTDAGEIDTVIVAFADHYGRLHGKRFDASFFIDDAVANGTHACDYLLTVDMEMEPVAGYSYASWEQGFGDFHLVPDLETLRLASWLDRTALVLCDVEDETKHAPVAVAPRSVLRRQIEHAAAAGFTAKGASELEYYIFDDSYREAAKKKYSGLEPAGWYLEDYHLLQGSREERYNGPVRRHLAASGVPVENSKGEWGRGQHEMNIRYSELLTMADRHSVMKLAMKEIADATGVSVTFMAKPVTEEAGSGCHVHVSLWQDGGSAFSNEGGADTDAFRWFLGGWMAHVGDVMAFYAPTINSYKRYQPGSWAPVGIAWSEDNRTAGFRVVGSGASRRIECRLPGADCNPYLVYAAVLASGLDGIANKTEPPAEFVGDVYQARDLPRVPATLREAATAFAKSDFAREAFGAEVHEHYSHFFDVEATQYDNAVTDWERWRYFERI